MRLLHGIALTLLGCNAMAEEVLVPLTALPSEAVATDPMQVELGRLLFFDPVLSATKTVACATCHQPQHGWTDERETARGFTSLTRNTPTILNVAFNADGVMFWDNRERTLEAQVLHPIRAREEMRGDACEERNVADLIVKRVQNIDEYRRRFDGEVTMSKIATAIATFERTLITTDTPFDKFMRGDKTALKPHQQRGLKAFEESGCIHCHGGPMLSDYKLHVIGAPGERQAFRTPSLRNLKHTAPFMHNGRMHSLDEVLLFYEQLMDEVSETIEGGDNATQPPLDPLLKHLQIKPGDLLDLKAFLESLSVNAYDQKIPAWVPSGLHPGGE
jgi:cytochrome c peroxidase